MPVTITNTFYCPFCAKAVAPRNDGRCTNNACGRLLPNHIRIFARVHPVVQVFPVPTLIEYEGAD